MSSSQAKTEIAKEILSVAFGLPIDLEPLVSDDLGDRS